MPTHPTITLYTDGAASGNPGPGGYGAVLLCGELRKELSGGFALTTNNRMELLAVIKGLEAIRWANADIDIFSDSTYVVKAINEHWLDKWKRTGFNKVKNPDLWQKFVEVSAPHTLRFHWVKGHDRTVENNRCDALAVEARSKADLPQDEGYLPVIAAGQNQETIF